MRRCTSCAGRIWFWQGFISVNEFGAGYDRTEHWHRTCWYAPDLLAAREGAKP